MVVWLHIASDLLQLSYVDMKNIKVQRVVIYDIMANNHILFQAYCFEYILSFHYGLEVLFYIM